VNYGNSTMYAWFQVRVPGTCKQYILNTNAKFALVAPIGPISSSHKTICSVNFVDKLRGIKNGIYFDEIANESSNFLQTLFGRAFESVLLGDRPFVQMCSIYVIYKRSTIAVLVV
jgi:hypothetical protein